MAGGRREGRGELMRAMHNTRRSMALAAFGFALATAFAGEYVGDFSVPSDEHSNKKNVAGSGRLELGDGVFSVDGDNYSSRSLTQHLYVSNGYGGYIDSVTSAGSAQKTMAENAVKGVLGQSASLQSLLDKDVYVTSADDGSTGGAPYIIVSNLALNHEPSYNDGTWYDDPNTDQTIAGAMDVPLVLISGNGDGMVLAPYARDDYAAVYTPLFVAVEGNESVKKDVDYLMAVVQNRQVFENVYQGICQQLDPAHAYDEPFWASDSETYADFIHERAAALQTSATGEAATVLPLVQLDSLNRFTDVVKDALRVAHTSAVGFAPATSLDRSGYDLMGGWRVWGDLARMYDKRDHGRAVGYKLDEYGLTLGADKRILGNDFLVGGALSYAWGEMTTSGHRNKTLIDTFHAEIYGGWTHEKWFASAGVGYSFYGYRGLHDKVADTKSGEFDGSAINVFAEIGYRYELRDWVFLPTVGVDYTHLSTDSYHMGNNVWGKKVFKSSPDSLNSYRTPVRLAVMRDFDGLIGSLRLGWTHDWTSDDTSSKSAILSSQGQYNSFAVRGLDPMKNYYNVGVGFDFNVNRFATSILYDFTFGSGLRNHSLNLRAGVSF